MALGWELAIWHDSGIVAGEEGIMGETPMWIVKSPDGHLALRVVLEEGGLSYHVTREARGHTVTVMEKSPLGLRLDIANLTEVRSVEEVEERRVDEKYQLVAGKRISNRVLANETTIRFVSADEQAWDLILRAGNDGVAFRYRVTEPLSEWSVIDESSSFAVPPGRAWIAPYDHVGTWGPAYETLFTNGEPVGGAPALGSREYPGWQLPALFSVNRLWMLLTEADLGRCYCGCHLSVDTEGRYRIAFPSEDEALGNGAPFPSGDGTLETPWRVIAVSPNLAGIVETSFVSDLASERRISDVSWITPGRSAWSWWSDFNSSTDHDALISFIDLAGEMGWEYVTIDANWHTIPEEDLDRLLRHAAERNVRPLLWYNSGGPTNDVPEGPRDRLFDAEERERTLGWLAERGVAGLKVDFFDSDKQLVIGKYLDLLEAGAEHRLLMNFHGSTLPRGWERTWPHCITMEAVRGGEQYRLDASWAPVAPSYNAILPFTRAAVGPTDYTPVALGGPGVRRVTTDAHELALCIVLHSGILTVAASAESIRALPESARQFLTDVPVTWDETKLVAGEPGRLAVLARRSGTQWWVGGISGEDDPLPLAIDTSFLDDGEYVITLITDAADQPALRDTRRTIGGREIVNVRLVPAGGFVARIVPIAEATDPPERERSPRAF